jgi:hypothetical protein
MTKPWHLAIEAPGYKALNVQVMSAESHVALVTLQPVANTAPSALSTVQGKTGCAR